MKRKHYTLNVCSRGKYLFSESLNVPRDEVDGNIEIRGRKNVHSRIVFHDKNSKV